MPVIYTQHGTPLLFVSFSQPIYKDTKSPGTKIARKIFFQEETSLAQLQTAHALFKVRQHSFLMPQNPIHPGRNSRNTSDVPPETNLVQSALKSCLIYTHFSLALKPSVPVLHPLPSPTGQGATALTSPPQSGAAGLVLAVPWQSTEGDA